MRESLQNIDVGVSLWNGITEAQASRIMSNLEESAQQKKPLTVGRDIRQNGTVTWGEVHLHSAGGLVDEARCGKSTHISLSKVEWNCIMTQRRLYCLVTTAPFTAVRVRNYPFCHHQMSR